MFKKGDIVIDTSRPDFGKGQVLQDTSTNGLVAIQFYKNIGYHTCQGLGEEGYCYYSAPLDVVLIIRGNIQLELEF